MVRGHGGRESLVALQFETEFQAPAPCGFLQIPGLENTGIQAARKTRHAVRRAQFAHERLVGVGFGAAKAVIHVQNREIQASVSFSPLQVTVEQENGIGTA